MPVVGGIVVLHSAGIKYRSPESPHTTCWVREKKSKLVLIGIRGCSLSASGVSVPSIDRCGQLYGSNKIASSSESSVV